MTIQDAIHVLEQSRTHLMDRPNLVRGKLGMPDASGNHRVLTNRAGYHWVRLYGTYEQGVQAYNNKTSATYDLDVYVTIDPYRTEGVAPYVVLGTVANVSTVMDPLLDEKSRAEEIVGSHAAAHEFSDMNVGRDALSIYARALAPLRVQEASPASMQVFVNSGYFIYSGENILFRGGLTRTISAPASGIRSDLVYLDCINNIVGVEQGVAAITIYDIAEIPTLPASSLPLAYILLKPDTTNISEQNIFDYRPFLTRSSKELVVDKYGDAVVDNDGERLYA